MHPDGSESISHFVEFEWLDDGHDYFHRIAPAWPLTGVELKQPRHGSRRRDREQGNQGPCQDGFS
jgi:hypothetical protein